MSDEPKWRTKAYTITGWIGFGLFLLVIAVDIVLALIKWPTLSQYVHARTEDQPLFGWIVLGLIIFLIFHWFWRFVRRRLKK